VIARLRRDITTALLCGLILVFWAVPGSVIRWRYARAQASGGTLWLDAFERPARKE
jgi:hypothetical protein